MAKRSYNQFCPLAKALDRLGDRWTLLIIRDLILGPQTYSELLASMPAMGTNQLADRLKALAKDGIVKQEGAGKGATYKLVPNVQTYWPMIQTMMRWQLACLELPKIGESMRPSWAMLALRASLNMDYVESFAEEVSYSYRFRVDGEDFMIEVQNILINHCTLIRGTPARRCNAFIETKSLTVFEFAIKTLDLEKAMRLGVARVDPESEKEAIERFGELFGVSSGEDPRMYRWRERTRERVFPDEPEDLD